MGEPNDELDLMLDTDNSADVLDIRVVQIGKAFTHRLETWPIFVMDFRLFKFTCGSEKFYHGLIRDDLNLAKTPRPYNLKVLDHPDSCFVKSDLSEFSHAIKVQDLSLLPEGILIVWKWDQFTAEDDDEHGEGAVGESGDWSDREFFEEDTLKQQTHTVVFKCIGTTKERGYQEALRLISHLPLEDTIVKLRPEPENPYDSKAIAFVVNLGNNVVRDLVDEVHQALEGNLIQKTSFSWIKYLVEWPRSGPGFYCGISITKHGKWSNNAIKCQSLLIINMNVQTYEFLYVNSEVGACQQGGYEIASEETYCLVQVM